MRSRYWILPLLCLGGLVALGNSVPSKTISAAQSATETKTRFSSDTVLKHAQELAKSRYVRPTLAADHPLRALNYDQYRDIRFQQEAAVWGREQVPFRLDLLPAGFIYEMPVRVSVVENGRTIDLAATPEMYSVGQQDPKVLAGANIPLSGFRVRNRLNTQQYWDEFLVFQGASYFRAIAKDQIYGLSARGLAIGPAEPTGEEFPAFTHFWIERPSANANGIVIHALLNSESVTGAYRFSIVPGHQTVMDVEFTLFPRVDIPHVGVAPLTSMFMFNESHRVRIDDFRDAVHDSDGLVAVLSSGEQIWRPIANPVELQVSSFTSDAPRAFGLLQRSRLARDFNDLEARYEDRPSVWVEPTSDWGAGAVQLIEIPTDRETVDNIVALWRKAEPLRAGQPWSASYRLRWNARASQAPDVAIAASTRSGPTLDGKRRVFVVDFRGRGTSIEGLRLEASASQGKLVNPLLQSNSINSSIRASVELDPQDANLSELRLRLMRGDTPVSETWLYRWTPT